VALAWHVEAFARTKRLPELKTLLQGRARETPGPSFAALRAHLERYQAARDARKTRGHSASEVSS
jgi:hypothetical protein